MPREQLEPVCERLCAKREHIHFNDNNFLSLRDLGALLGFGVNYDEETNTAEITANNDRLPFADASVTVLTPKLDGEYVNVTMYEDTYCSDPSRPQDQRISIYVPENATADSPIMFYVSNTGWMSDAYENRYQVFSYGYGTTLDQWTFEMYTGYLGDYHSNDDTDKIGTALVEGYVIVSYGGRSRIDEETDAGNIGHSPATMTDTKAAIRYLRYNSDILPAGDTDKIVVTGGSGGGALSTVIAASGNSSDYYESLYKIGAAGIVKDSSGATPAQTASATTRMLLSPIAP